MAVDRARPIYERALHILYPAGLARTINGTDRIKVAAELRHVPLKVDVEGHEHEVLAGALGLLGDPGRCPKVVCVGLHPFAWDRQATQQGMIELLERNDYGTQIIQGDPHTLDWIVAEHRPAGG